MALELHEAARQGDVAKIQKLLGGGLLRKKADVNAQDEHGMTALHWAALKGHVEAVRALLRHGADVNAADKTGATPLHKAAMGGHVDIAAALQEAGAALLRTDRAGHTPLDVALAARQTAVAEALRRLYAPGPAPRTVRSPRLDEMAYSEVEEGPAGAMAEMGEAEEEERAAGAMAEMEYSAAAPLTAAPAGPKSAPAGPKSPAPAPSRPAPVAPGVSSEAEAEEITGSFLPVEEFEDSEAVVEEEFALAVEEFEDSEAVVEEEFALVREDFDTAFADEASEEAELPTTSGIKRHPAGAAALDRDAFEATGAARDQVDCSVFAPPEVAQGDSMMVQAFAHLAAEAEAVKAAAQEFDEEAERRGTTVLSSLVARGSVLGFQLTMRGLNVIDPSQELVWQGRMDSVQFEVEVPHTASGNVISEVVISQDNIPIGRIKFKTKVVALMLSAPEPQPTGEAQRFKQAFISYASADREEVLRRVQMLGAVGIKYFQDVLDLEPGEHWEPVLYQRIDESDVMFLFWSQAARDSEWVAKEWHYALDQKGLDFIMPVVIEGPPAPLPPKELQELHFSDRIIYFMHPGQSTS